MTDDGTDDEPEKNVISDFRRLSPSGKLLVVLLLIASVVIVGSTIYWTHHHSDEPPTNDSTKDGSRTQRLLDSKRVVQAALAAYEQKRGDARSNIESKLREFEANCRSLRQRGASAELEREVVALERTLGQLSQQLAGLRDSLNVVQEKQSDLFSARFENVRGIGDTELRQAELTRLREAETAWKTKLAATADEFRAAERELGKVSDLQRVMVNRLVDDALNKGLNEIEGVRLKLSDIIEKLKEVFDAGLRTLGLEK